MSLRVAIVDSGVNGQHPHVGGIALGARVMLSPSGVTLLTGLAEASDAIGHGTACAGLVRWLAPEAEIVAVRIFDSELRAPADRLPQALAFCREHGARVINLSLGLRPSEVPPEAHDALEATIASGAVVVAAIGNGVEPSWPATHRQTIAVAPDPQLAPGVVAWIEAGLGLDASGGSAATTKPLVLAAPFPRPMPGQPRERNLRGVSFAAAAVSGIVAREWILDPTLTHLAGSLAASPPGGTRGGSTLDRLQAIAVEHFASRPEWLAERGVT